LGGFEKEERGKKRRERKGERREKRGKKGGQPNPHSERKNANYKKTFYFIFLFNFFVFLNFFEMKLRLDLENPKSAIKKWGGVIKKLN
jgi:hypothetical protein